jgi:hypothetical protein
MDSKILSAWSPWTPRDCWRTPKLSTRCVPDSVKIMLNGTSVDGFSYLAIVKIFVENAVLRSG